MKSMFDGERILTPKHTIGLRSFTLSGDIQGFVSGCFRLIHNALELCQIDISGDAYNPTSSDHQSAGIWLSLLRQATDMATTASRINLTGLSNSLPPAVQRASEDYPSALRAIITSLPSKLASTLFSYDLECSACGKTHSVILTKILAGSTDDSLASVLSSSFSNCPNCKVVGASRITSCPMLMSAIIPDTGVKNIPLRLNIHTHQMALSAVMTAKPLPVGQAENYTIYANPNTTSSNEIFALFLFRSSSVRRLAADKADELTFLKPHKVDAFLQNDHVGQISERVGSVRLVFYIGLEYLNASARMRLLDEFKVIQADPQVILPPPPPPPIIQPAVPQELSSSEYTEETSEPSRAEAPVYSYNPLVVRKRKVCCDCASTPWWVWLWLAILTAVAIIVFIMIIVVYANLNGTLVVQNLVVQQRALVGYSSFNDPAIPLNVPRNFPVAGSSASHLPYFGLKCYSQEAFHDVFDELSAAYYSDEEGGQPRASDGASSIFGAVVNPPAVYNLISSNVRTVLLKANTIEPANFTATSLTINAATINTLTATSITAADITATNINAKTITFTNSMIQGPAATVSTWTVADQLTVAALTVTGQSTLQRLNILGSLTAASATITTLDVVNINLNALTVRTLTVTGSSDFTRSTNTFGSLTVNTRMTLAANGAINLAGATIISNAGDLTFQGASVVSFTNNRVDIRTLDATTATINTLSVGTITSTGPLTLQSLTVGTLTIGNQLQYAGTATPILSTQGGTVTLNAPSVTGTTRVTGQTVDATGTMQVGGQNFANNVGGQVTLTPNEVRSPSVNSQTITSTGSIVGPSATISGTMTAGKCNCGVTAPIPTDIDSSVEHIDPQHAFY